HDVRQLRRDPATRLHRPRHTGRLRGLRLNHRHWGPATSANSSQFRSHQRPTTRTVSNTRGAATPVRTSLLTPVAAPIRPSELVKPPYPCYGGYKLRAGL